MFNIQNKYTSFGCYRFLDSQGKAIYIGSSKNIHRRLFSQHFKKGHLTQICYDSTYKIEIVKTKDYAEALAFEIWAIDQYKPKFNKKDKSKDIFRTSFYDNELYYRKLDKSWKLYYTFKEYDFNKIKISKLQNRVALAGTYIFFIVLIGYMLRSVL